MSVIYIYVYFLCPKPENHAATFKNVRQEKQVLTNSICHHIYWISQMHLNPYKNHNTHSLPVQSSSYHLCHKSAYTILSNVFRGTAKQSTQEVESIRCGFQPYSTHQTFGFPTLYTTILYGKLKLKNRLASSIRNFFNI